MSAHGLTRVATGLLLLGGLGAAPALDDDAAQKPRDPATVAGRETVEAPAPPPASVDPRAAEAYRMGYGIARGIALSMAHGLRLAEVDATVRAQLNIPADQGLVVTGVIRGGAGEQAGFLVNDILLTYDGQPARKVPALTQFSLGGEVNELRWLRELPLRGRVILPGGRLDPNEPSNDRWREVRVEILRGGKPMTLTLKIPESTTVRGQVWERRTPDLFAAQGKYFIGVPVGPVDEVLRAHLDIPAGRGLVATDVVAGSPAAQAGIQKHDILLEANNQPLTDTQSLLETIEKSEGKPIELKLYRAGKMVTLSVTPSKRATTLAAPLVTGGRPSIDPANPFSTMPYINVDPRAFRGLNNPDELHKILEQQRKLLEDSLKALDSQKEQQNKAIEELRELLHQLGEKKKGA